MVPIIFVASGLSLSFIALFFWPYPPVSWVLLAAGIALASIHPEIALALLPLTFPYYLDLKPLTFSNTPAFSLIEFGLFTCALAALLRHVFLPNDRLATR